MSERNKQKMPTNKTSEFDSQRNTILYSCICVSITIAGVLVALGFAYGLDGSCVTNSFFNGESPEKCITGNTNTNDKDITCPKGFWGKDCLPCLNCYGHGVCYGSGTTDKYNMPGDGTCLCNKGFTGLQCNKCLPGYYGPNCKPCDNCNNNGVCVGTGSISNSSNTQRRGSCQCFYPFTGKHCNQCLPGLFGEKCDMKCNSKTCVNGICDSNNNNNNNASVCKCNKGYKGVTCNNQCEPGYDLIQEKCIFNYTNYCIQNQSKGNVVNNKNYMNFYGTSCTLCNDLTCNGHGQCNSGINGGGHCTCDKNWGGTSCDKNETHIINAFTRCSGGANDDATLCNSNGVCYVSQQGNKVCICSKGYTGNNCSKCDDGYEVASTSTTKCKSVCALTGMEHCYGHGTCNTATKTCTCASNTSATAGFYTGQFCGTCKLGFYGKNCAKCPAAASCVNGNCKGSGTNEGDGTCSCLPGYEGAQCDACAYGYTLDTASNSCKRCPVNSITKKVCNAPYGSCVIGNKNDAVCKCVDGYEGSTCEIKKIGGGNIDKKCINNCYNNGKCSNGICFCNSKFTGAYCNITAQPKCTATSCATCETCNANTGFCELIDRCCGRGEYFDDKCFCKRGYTGTDCSATLTPVQQKEKQYAWKWLSGEYTVGADGNICSKLCNTGLKTREITCVEYTNEKDSTTYAKAADSKCANLKKPDGVIECNRFPCSGENDNTDVRVVTLTLDMDYTTVMNDAHVSETFEDSLIEDFNILTNGITNKNNVEIMTLKEGSVKVSVILYTADNKKVLEKIDAAIKDDGASAEATIGRNEIQALKIVTKTNKIVKSDQLTSKEANTYIIEDTASDNLAAGGNQVVSSNNDVSNKKSSVTSGGAAAISVITVFVFIGLIVGIGGFIRAKRDWIKKMATQSTASRPQQVEIKLTAEEHNNPLMLQMSGDKNVLKNTNDKKGSALASAVATVQRAIQLDNEHNWKEAVKFYKKANDQFAIVLENETNANTRFALAKKVNGYLEREQFLTKKLGDTIA